MGGVAAAIHHLFKSMGLLLSRGSPAPRVNGVADPRCRRALTFALDLNQWWIHYHHAARRPPSANAASPSGRPTAIVAAMRRDWRA